MKLSDKLIQQLQPREKQYKASDGHNLFICVHPRGGKYWRYKYHWLGKEKSLALGVYPEVSLEEARDMRQEARKLKRLGTDPSEYKRQRKIRASSESGNTFELLAREWLEIRSSNWSPGYLKAVTSRLKNDILPEIGHRPLGTILPTDVLKIARTVERRDSFDISRKALQVCGQIFRYGIATGRSVSNPADNLWTALRARKSKPRPFFGAHQLSQFLQDLECFRGHKQTIFAIKLMLLTFVRTKELCDATHAEFDVNTKLWRIPAKRMKMEAPHIVPISDQALHIIKILNSENGRWDHLLSNTTTPREPISKFAMRHALLDMGYKGLATIHGIRATASTILNESGLFSADAIERQLGHCEPNKIRRAYDHSNHLAERVRMMQWWADYLTGAGLQIPDSQGSVNGVLYTRSGRPALNISALVRADR